MLSTDRKGAIAEAEIAAAAIKIGIDVYRPLFEGGRYDLIFGVGVHNKRRGVSPALMGDTPHGNTRALSPPALTGDTPHCNKYRGPAPATSSRFRSAPSLGVNWADEFALESLHSEGYQGP